MTVNPNNPETKRNENIKNLNAVISQKDGGIYAVAQKSRDLKRCAEQLLNEQRAKIKIYDDEVRRRQVQEQAEKQRIIDEQLAKTVPAEDVKPQKAVTEEKPAAPAPVAPAVQPKSAENVRTGIPSYIRGTITQKPPMPRSTPAASGTRPAPRAGGAPRPSGAFPPKKPMLPKTGTTSLLPLTASTATRKRETKKDYQKTEDKNRMSKRTLIRKGYIQEDMDEERMGTRKLKNRKPKETKQFIPQKIETAVITTENLTVKILSEKIGKTAQEIIKQLMLLGIMTNINSVVDFATMELVASALGVKLELKIAQTKEEKLEEEHLDDSDEQNLVKRPPIITVMGHVDHGKTSLLDAIRLTAVASEEAGGITQHIGAYSVVCKGEKITFLDTPGHEAFTQMRARGAKVTDIAVLIVAADDGVMPQTVEAIDHAKAAQVPIIVAINKMDKPGADPERIKQQLTNHGLVCEEWGGDVMTVPISAKTGKGIDKLLENILFMAEYYNYRANPDRNARGSVIEAKIDKGKGPIANIIVQNGTMRVGDFVVSGTSMGRVRAMIDDKGKSIKEAGPSMPISVLGFNDVPMSGDQIFVVADEKMAKQVIDERTVKIKNELLNQGQPVTLDDVFNKISESKVKDFNVIIKADVQGSFEALKSSLVKLYNEEVRVNVIGGGVGAITQSDLMLAEVSKAVIVGFNIRPDTEAKAAAERAGVQIKLYRIIYEAITDIENAMKGLLAPKYTEVVMGRAQVRNIFNITGAGIIAGSYILSGKFVRGSKARVYRGEDLIFEGNINGLKRFKDDVKEVNAGYECGISVSDFGAYKENDEIECYILEEIK